MLRTLFCNDFSGRFPRLHICPDIIACTSENKSHWRCTENSYIYSQWVGCFPSLLLTYCVCYFSFQRIQPVTKATGWSPSNSQHSVASPQTGKAEKKYCVTDRPSVQSRCCFGFFFYLIVIFLITSYVSVLNYNMEVLLKVMTPLLQFQELILLINIFNYFLM